MIILKILIFIIALHLSACTTIKVVEVDRKIDMPKFDYSCKELELLSALETMKNNEVIHQECINLAKQQNIFIKRLAK